MAQNVLSERKTKVRDFMDRIAADRERYLRQNRYYYQDLDAFFRWHIPAGSRVLEIGCGLGDTLASLAPSFGVGVDLSPGMVARARQKHPGLVFLEMDAEELTCSDDPALAQPFDYILLSDTLGYIEDIQKLLQQLACLANPQTRILITYHNYLWQPVLALAEQLHLKMPQIHLNWLNETDILNLLYLEGFDVIKAGRRFLLPSPIPGLAPLVNRVLGRLPGINRLCITGFIIARVHKPEPKPPSVSVIVPARNEKGNIEQAVRRMPRMAPDMEIIFVEGGSTDGTLAEIQRVCAAYEGQWDLRWMVQDGRGKGDAVRKGFEAARGDLLFILDADLTVPPEDLPKFYQAIAGGRGEYINGSRLVYPLEEQAMYFLNMLGNKFFSTLFSWILDQPLKDTLCGTKVISRQNWQRLIANRAYFGDFDPFGDFDLIFGAAKLDLKFVEIPIRYRARAYGQTNISRFKHGWLLLQMALFALGRIKFV